MVLGFITVNLYSGKIGLQIEMDARVLASIASYQKNVQALNDSHKILNPRITV